MSLILDALNRSRQDTDDVPGLATQHYVDSDAGSGRSYSLWLALLVALLVILWLMYDRYREPVLTAPEQSSAVERPRQQETQAPAARAEAPAVAAPTRPAPPQPSAPPQVTSPRATAAVKAEPQPVAAPAGVREAAVDQLYQQRQSPPPQPAARPVPAPTPEKASAPAVAAEPAAAGEEQPIDIEKVVLQAQDELQNARLEEHPAPFLSDMSQQTKDQIPTILYQRHDYSGNPAQSEVVLNGSTVKVGGNAASGVKLDEILPDSIVLNYRGTQFRLRALNSWVNL